LAQRMGRGPSTFPVGCGHVLVNMLRRGVALPVVSPRARSRTRLAKLLKTHPHSARAFGREAGDPGEYEADGALREAHWRVFAAGGARVGGDPLERWSACVQRSVTAAIAAAQVVGARSARRLDLLEALLADTCWRARGLVNACGTRPGEVLTAALSRPGVSGDSVS
jgi:hypothetical protein